MDAIEEVKPPNRHASLGSTSSAEKEAGQGLGGGGRQASQPELNP